MKINKAVRVAWILLVSTSFMGCGTDPAEDTQKTNQNAKESAITIQNIETEENTKTFHMSAVIRTEEEIASGEYEPDHAQVYRTDIEPVEQGWSIDWYGFYNDIEQVETPVIKHNFETCFNVQGKPVVGKIEARQFEVSTDGKQFVVWLTPYSICVQGDTDISGENIFYTITASGTKQNEYYVTRFPISDERKVSEKKEEPLTETDTDAIPQLGDGFAGGDESGNSSAEYIFRETIAPAVWSDIQQFHFETAIE
ncbi:MAG: hypothetical protein SO015_09405 [Wujia sp.]|nr:hypothetical protein [Wujia sp.]MDY3728355.1 hypothetical protein [Wujia sp.]